MTRLVDDGRALGPRVGDELFHVLGRHGRERRDGALAKGRAGLEARDGGAELLDERRGRALVHKDELDRGAALAVVGGAPREALPRRHIEVSVRQHHAQILGVLWPGTTCLTLLV